MVKVILVSQFRLPYHNIGSWTTLYENFLSKTENIDFVVCERPFDKHLPVNYSYVNKTLVSKIVKKITKNPYSDYIQAILNIINGNNLKYIIQVVDNFGIIKPLQKELIRKGVRENCYIQFFYHGYSPFCKNITDSWFYEYVDEMILLTYLSYEVHKNYYTVLPTRFSVLHNGIDTQKFYKVNEEQKLLLKQQLGVANKKVFLWCSQDRPKKGLHLILEAWQRIYANRQDVVLWVIGCEPKSPEEGVMYLGRIPNDELPSYFQASDCYLFPTLCHEGFGLSLIEALHCGNYCIASANGGVPEVLQYGKYGKLIEYPNFVTAWEEAMLEFLEAPLVFESLAKEMYSTESWNKAMNQIINRAKQSMMLYKMRSDTDFNEVLKHK